jgi:dehydrogenase/reductase SDR family protein 1
MPVAFVTGASRGVGRGIAIALHDAGYHVCATGRSIQQADLPLEIERIPCDHRDDVQTAAAFARLGDSALDVLVNSAWGGYEQMSENGQFTWLNPFWEQPMHRWTSMLDAGVRAAFVASSQAARRMVQQKRGLIVNISSWAAQKYAGNTLYGVSKAATDNLTSGMAHELRPHGVAAVSLYPGLVRTEKVLAAAAEGWFDLANSESPEFTGRVIAALARDPALIERSGQWLVVAALAAEYGVQDIDGRQPKPLTLETA